jgi:hypothetical protein
VTGQIQHGGDRAAQDGAGLGAQGPTAFEDGFEPGTVQDPDPLVGGQAGQHLGMGGRSVGGALLQDRQQVSPELGKQVGGQRLEAGGERLLAEFGRLDPQQ